jgi:hypothetical protein
LNFEGGKMDFQEAERRYDELKRQFDVGTVGVHEFNAQRQQLMVQDDEGRWWAKSPTNDEWNYYDGSAWVPSTPPGYQEVTSEPTDLPAQTPSPPHPKGVENGENGRQRMPPWILVTWLAGISLVGIVLGWTLVSYLQGEPAPIEQGEPIQSEQGEQKPVGAALDAVFIHRATPENISGHNTYLDNSLTNNNPNAILYVTQNWNPGGSGDTYNDHPIGVWYNQDTQRWAIFNQDREAMPDGAAFNVAVLEEPTEAR